MSSCQKCLSMSPHARPSLMVLSIFPIVTKMLDVTRLEQYLRPYMYLMIQLTRQQRRVVYHGYRTGTSRQA
jgi:hypothetical protein